MAGWVQRWFVSALSWRSLSQTGSATDLLPWGLVVPSLALPPKIYRLRHMKLRLKLPH